MPLSLLQDATDVRKSVTKKIISDEAALSDGCGVGTLGKVKTGQEHGLTGQNQSRSIIRGIFMAENRLRPALKGLCDSLDSLAKRSWMDGQTIEL